MSILIVEDVPRGLEFGIDCMSYEVGPKFRGVSSIPNDEKNDIHLVYCSSLTGFSRSAFFIRTNDHAEINVDIAKWSKDREELLYINETDEAYSTLRGNYERLIYRGELNENLAAYPVRQSNLWRNISNYITLDVLNRAKCGVGIIINSDCDPNDDIPDNILKQYENSKFQLTDFDHHNNNRHIAHFCPVDDIESRHRERLVRQNLYAQMTIDSMDKTWLIQEMLEQYYNQSSFAILGELQLAFLLLLTLYSHSALQHWKKLLTILCQSASFLINHVNFASNLIRCLYSQLSFAPEDFFEAEISKDNFLVEAFSSLFSALSEVQAHLKQHINSAASERVTSSMVTSNPEQLATLIEHKKRFANYLQKKFSLRIQSFDIETSDGKNTSDQMVSDASVITEEDFAAEERNFRFRQNAPSQQIDDSRVQDRWQSIFQQINEQGQSTVDPSVLIGHATAQSETMQAEEVPQDTEADLPSISALSFAEKQQMMFAWRYPLLVEQSRAQQGREDLLMTAMRIMEEKQYSNPNSDPLYNECVHFIEAEAQRVYNF